MSERRRTNPVTHPIYYPHANRGSCEPQEHEGFSFAEPMKAAAIKNAQSYGVAVLAGVAALPVAAVATFIGKDSVQQIIDVSFEHVYEVSLEVIKRMGKITKDDASGGAIKANINGANVALMLRKSPDNKTEITISVRKYIFPKLDIAGGVLYQILDKLQ